MLKILFSLIVSVSAFSFETGGLPLTRAPLNNECWPKSSSSKRYIEIKKLPFLRLVKFTCLYICLDGNGRSQEIEGTLEVRIFGKEKGNESVCKGYEKDMVFIETPMNPKSWGHYELGKVRPFLGRSSKISEIENWYRELGINLIPFRLQ